MDIWLIMSGEPLEQFNERPHRVGIISKMLVEQGHEALWWTTAYDHQHKKYLFNKDTELVNHLGVNMVFLYPKSAYKKNISFSRIINHKQVAKKFKLLSKNKKTPDLIFCAYPTIDLAYQAVKYGKENNVPVVIDVRDMWPDIFVKLLPTYFKSLARLSLVSMYKKASYVFSNSYAITGITEPFVEFGLNYAKRNKNVLDKSFPFGYPEVKQSSNRTYKNLETIIDFDKYIICFFGTIGKQFDFKPVIEVAKILEKEAQDVLFVICGNGSHFEELENNTQGLTNFVLPGWLKKEEVEFIMKKSKLAISPYNNSEDFLNSISNKTIEYMAGGLPILSSIEGVSGSLLVKNNCGVIYSNLAGKLYEVIISIKNNEIKQKEMSKNAIDLYKEKFSAKKVYSEMIEYFGDIIKAHKKSKKDA